MSDQVCVGHFTAAGDILSYVPSRSRSKSKTQFGVAGHNLLMILLEYVVLIVCGKCTNAALWTLWEIESVPWCYKQAIFFL